MRGTFPLLESPAAPVTSPEGSLVSNLWDSSERSCPRGGAWIERGFKERLIRMQRTPPRVPREREFTVRLHSSGESIVFSSQQVLSEAGLELRGV